MQSTICTNQQDYCLKENSNESLSLPPNKRFKPSNSSSNIQQQQQQTIKTEQTTTTTTTITKTNSNSNISTNENSLLNTRKQFACLRNLGSTCYINCIVQVMRYSPGFTLSINRLAKQIDYLKSLNVEMEKEISNNQDTIFVKQLHELLNEMSDKEKSDRRPIYSPRKFVNTVWNSLSFWSDGSQQDAHEFLQYILHFINECDLYLKKLHQQYQLNQLEAIDNKHKQQQQQQQSQSTSSISSSSSTTNATASNNATTTQQIFKCKSVNCLSSVQSSPKQQQQQQPPTTIKLSNSANYLRTPTKGGASVCTTSSSATTSSTAIAQEQPTHHSSLVITELSRRDSTRSSPIITIAQTKTTPIATPTTKITKTNTKQRLSNEEEVIFKPLIKEENDTTPLKSPSTLLNPLQQIKNAQNITKIKSKTNILEQLIQQEHNKRQQSNDIEVIEIKNSNNNNNNNEDYNNRTSDVAKTSEKIIIKKNVNENELKQKFNLKECYVLVERLDENRLKNGIFYLNNNNNSNNTNNDNKQSKEYFKQQISTKNNQESHQQQQQQQQLNIRKLKTKSKTFPEVKSVNHTINEPIDAITLVSGSTTTLNTNSSSSSSSTTKSGRSKTRTNSLNESIVCNPIQIPSPAELLRKYSSIKGYICEMDKIFKGSSVTLTQCLACETQRKCPEAFYDRSLPVNTNSNEPMDFDWMLKCLSNESYLDEDSKYMCDICASKQEAKIYTQYTEMPNILILHLLSYGITANVNGNLNTQKLNNRSRLLTYFDCICNECINNSNKCTNNNNNNNTTTTNSTSSPTTTTSTTTTTQQQQQQKPQQTSPTNKHVFKLYAVVMHSGVSLNNGHYTAFVNYQIINETVYERDISNSKKPEYPQYQTNSTSSTTTETSPEWLHFDDSRVKLLTNNEFQRKISDSSYDSPYILFYVKDIMLT